MPLSPLDQPLVQLSSSTFHMLRCVVVVAHADKIVKESERNFMKALLTHIRRTRTITGEQEQRLQEDLAAPQAIEGLIPHVTEKEDREDLVLFAGLLAMADGEMHPEEAEVLKRIGVYCDAANAASMHRDVVLFNDDTRRIVRQDSYVQALATSGVTRQTGRAAVADAFAEKSTFVPNVNVYEAMAENPYLGSAMRRTMMPGERVISRAHFHVIYTLRALLGSGLILAAGKGAAALLHRFDLAMLEILSAGEGRLSQGVADVFYATLTNKTLGNALYYAVPGLALLNFLWAVIRRWTTEVVLTDRRLLFKRGVFTIQFIKIDLRQLYQTEITQSRLGNLLDYGTPYIYTTFVARDDQVREDDRNIALPQIADPHGFCSAIDRAKRMLRAQGD